MTCKFTITLPAGSIDLTSPMDWWECHAVILAQMGIKDANPVLTEAQADKIGQEAAEKERKRLRARSGAATR